MPNGVSLTVFLARNMTSYPAKGAPSSLPSPLIRLLARLRQTAFPSFFPAIKATRPVWSCCSLLRATIKLTSGVPIRCPRSKIEEISELDLIVLTLSLDGETLATLGAAASQHGTATPGGHASTEAMAFRAFASIRLVSAFHDSTLSPVKLEQALGYITVLTSVNDLKKPSKPPYIHLKQVSLLLLIPNTQYHGFALTKKYNSLDTNHLNQMTLRSKCRNRLVRFLHSARWMRTIPASRMTRSATASWASDSISMGLCEQLCGYIFDWLLEKASFEWKRKRASFPRLRTDALFHGLKRSFSLFEQG